MIDLAVLLVASWLVQSAQGAATSAPTIACEFRVFDGAEEVSRQTRVLVYPAGRKDGGVPVDASGRVSLASGTYDVQAIRERDGQVAAIRWLDHLLIQRYPDEEGFHLEVINFNPQYGALELRATDDAEYDVAVFPSGDPSRQVPSARRGARYLLFAMPAGRYDVRVKPGRPGDAHTPEFRLRDVDVPAGRTRLRSLRPPDAGPRGDR